MSAVNGDKSRFHRERKRKIARRRRNREMLGQAATPRNPVNPSAPVKNRPVTA